MTAEFIYYSNNFYRGGASIGSSFMFYCMCAFMGQAAWNKHDDDDDDTVITNKYM